MRWLQDKGVEEDPAENRKVKSRHLEVRGQTREFIFLSGKVLWIREAAVEVMNEVL